MADTETDTNGLDALFKAARRDTADLQPALKQRMLSDAAEVQAKRITRAAVRPGRWQQLRDVLGGWPGLGGLVAACATGIWLGVAPPATLPDPMQLVTQSEADLEFFDSDGLILALLEEG